MIYPATRDSRLASIKKHPSDRLTESIDNKIMNDDELLRYNRQIMLPQIDIDGQQKLMDAKVLIVGIGGLGSPASLYLASAGVGHLTLVDDDVVELSNLQRQIIHHDENIGDEKVWSAKHNLLKHNPLTNITTIGKRLDSASLQQQVIQADIVLDATDNFESRYLINHACVTNNTPLVSGAAIRFEGQVCVFTNRKNDPCYNCLYPNTGDIFEETCSENGILSPVVGVIGCMQAIECIKLICGIGEPLAGRLLVFDGLAAEWRTVRFKKDNACPICNGAT